MRALLPLLFLAGCSVLPSQAPPERLFTLAPALESKGAGQGGVLLVAPLRAHPALDTEAMAYRASPLTFDYYAKSRWVARPPELLRPFLVEALEGAFSAVLPMPAPVAGDFRLEVTVEAFQHELWQGRWGVVALRAALFDRRGVIGVRRFSAKVPSGGEDPQSGAMAINRALERLLPELAAWVAEAARSAHPP